MSTAPTATSSVACDLTLGNKCEIANCICVLATTQGNGTPFHPDSFQEKDIVKLCIGLGQAHPEGVLQLLDTKTVLTFKSSSEMIATTCLFMLAMVWHDEPIKICVCPPMGTQVREYVALRGICFSGAHALILEGEAVSQSSPRGPSNNSTWALGTLMMPN